MWQKISLPSGHCTSQLSCSLNPALTLCCPLLLAKSCCTLYPPSKSAILPLQKHTAILLVHTSSLQSALHDPHLCSLGSIPSVGQGYDSVVSFRAADCRTSPNTRRPLALDTVRLYHAVTPITGLQCSLHHHRLIDEDGPFHSMRDYLQWLQKLVHIWQNFPCKANCGSDNKLNLWGFSVTKQSIMALFVPNVKTLASCIDLIQHLQWPPLDEPVFACAIWILPKVSAMVQGYWSLAPPHMSLRVAFWEVNMMGSQHSFLGSPYTHVRVTLPSSLHAVNSQFTLPLQWPSTKAKDNLSSMWELTCVLLFSHMANSMLHSQGPLPKIGSMFYFHKGRQGLRLRM